MPKRFSRGWLVACMFATCINAYPARQGKQSESYVSNFKFRDFTEKDYDFEDYAPEKFLDNGDKTSSESFEYDGTSSTTVKNVYARLPLVPEPDAEMLPAHYTGVQPPGVDHMEIKSLDSASMGSNHESTVADGTKMASGAGVVSSKSSLGKNGQSAVESNDNFKKHLSVESDKKNRKGEYSEAAGKKKAHEESDRYSAGHKDETSGDKSVEFKVEGQRDRGHNAVGYHNVYHKDEYKKDADFYDNDHKSEHFRKHGHYDEKHVATASDSRNGDNRAAEFSDVGATKKGNFEKSRTDKNAEGYKATSGHGSFYDKFDKFAKQTGADRLISKN